MPIDEVAVHERVAKFTARSVKADSKMNGLLTIVSMIDLTTLEGADSPGRVHRICQKAIRPAKNVPSVAAVCLYPNLIAQASEELQGSSVHLASVATGFPAGQVTIEAKIADVNQALQAGADEIDMVISRGALLAGGEQQVFNEVIFFKALCKRKEAHLKVILEVGELADFDQVRKVSMIAMQAGADFIKTSTGKIPNAASMAVTLVMIEAVRDFHQETGRMVGIKPAGGISSAKQALHYLVMLSETLGPEWISPEWFRFGASSLLNDVLRQIEKQRTGNYEGDDYVTVA